jgi:hypothetical protein
MLLPPLLPMLLPATASAAAAAAAATAYATAAPNVCCKGKAQATSACWYIAVDTLSTLGSLFTSIPPYHVVRDSGT